MAITATTPGSRSRLRPQKRVAEILQRLEAAYPDAKCSLNYNNPLELLIATILSAQCTDERVNIVTKTLFQKYKKPEDYAAAHEEQLQEEIRTTGFFRNKTRSLKGAARKLISDFNSTVPSTMDELLTLPGVARKTANVVLGNAFGIADGVVVDTHVSRVSQRLALTRHTDPENIELDLMKLLPREKWIHFSHMVILHGRNICKAPKPDCERCMLIDLCPASKVFLAAKATARKAPRKK